MIKEALNMKSDNPKLNRLLQVYIKSGFSVKEIKGGYQVEDKHSITKIFIEEKNGKERYRTVVQSKKDKSKAPREFLLSNPRLIVAATMAYLGFVTKSSQDAALAAAEAAKSANQAYSWVDFKADMASVVQFAKDAWEWI